MQANLGAGRNSSEQTSLPILLLQHRKAELADEACRSLDGQAKVNLVRHQDPVRPGTPVEQAGLP